MVSVLHSPKYPNQSFKTKNAQAIALVAMASFAMLFGTLILSFLLTQLRNPIWPPIGVSPISIPLSALATGVVLASSIFFEFGRRKELKTYLFFAWLFGIGFLALQYLTLSALFKQGQSLGSDIYSSSIFLIVTLHALHLIAGLLGVTWATFNRRKEFPRLGTQIVGWFWHFLGVVWTLIFLLIVL